MKILFYQRSDVIESSGGTEKVLISLASSLAESGYDVVYMINENKQGAPFFKLSEKVKFTNLGGKKFKGLRKIVFKLIKSTPLLKFSGYFDEYYNTSKNVSREIKKENPNLIILANPHDLIDVLYKQKYETPIIQMIHGFPEVVFSRKSKTIRKLTLSLIKRVNVSQVLMNSQVPSMKSFYGGKIVVIPNSVSVVFDNQPFEREKNKYTIINIGRITEIKNQKLIVEAFNILAKKYVNWEVHLWGRDDDLKYYNEIKALIKYYNLDDRIFFKGLTKNPIEKFKNADIFAFPSVSEGFGLALGEAMSAGLPSVGLSTTSAVNELIRHNENGFLANNNAEDFAEKLEELMSDSELRKKFGKNAKDFISQFTPEVVLEKWKLLIKETANENH